MDRQKLFTALAVLFTTTLIASQFLAAKVVAVPLGFELPVVGGALVFPAGFFAYALTYFSTDSVAEIYGKDQAQRLVWYGFGGLIALLVMAYIAIILPAGRSGVDQATFTAVVGSGTNIAIGGIAAYLISQNLDVILFHRIRDRTGSSMLWLRNIGSTSISQMVDTVVFISLAFAIVPSLLGVGVTLPTQVLIQLIAGQYLVKVLVAVVDTPFVYAVAAWADQA